MKNNSFFQARHRPDSKAKKSKILALKKMLKTFNKNQEIQEEIIRKNRFADFINKKYKFVKLTKHEIKSLSFEEIVKVMISRNMSMQSVKAAQVIQKYFR